VLAGLTFDPTIIINLIFSKKCVFLGYSSLHKGYKCLHVPSNRVYISRDVIFDESVFPFVNMPNSHNLPPMSESSLLLVADHFMDIAHSLPLLADHGACIERGSRLEVPPSSSPIYVNHGLLHGPALGCGEPSSSTISTHVEPAPALGLLPAQPCSSTASARPASGLLQPMEPGSLTSAPVPMHGETARASRWFSRLGTRACAWHARARVSSSRRIAARALHARVRLSSSRRVYAHGWRCVLFAHGCWPVYASTRCVV
jgi:hypothetical protein